MAPTDGRTLSSSSAATAGPPRCSAWAYVPATASPTSRPTSTRSSSRSMRCRRSERGARSAQLPPRQRRIRISAESFRRKGAVRRRAAHRRCRSRPHEIPSVERFIALEGVRPGWEDYEALVSDSAPIVEPVAIAERDLITLNYTSGTTSRPKGVMITHRNAWVNSIGVLVHHAASCADRYLWTLPMFHANGWGFVWTITAVGGTHVCLRKPDPARVLETVQQERITMLCAAPTVLIGLANAPLDLRGATPSGVRVLDRRRAAGRHDHRSDRRRARLDGDPRLRAHGNVTVHHYLRGAARALRRCVRAGRHQSAPRRGADYVRGTEGRGCREP